MASTKQIATALLTEHLRYTPLTLIDDIINTINELTNRAVDAAENGLLNAPPDALGFTQKAAVEKRTLETDEDGKPIYPDSRLEIEEGVHRLETLLESNIDKNFDKFEILALRGILSVPEDLVSWMRLAHYETVGNNANGAEIPTTDSLERILEQVQETRKLQKALKVTIKKNSAMIDQLRDLSSKTDRVSLDTQPGALSFLAHNKSASQLGFPSTSGTSTENRASPLTTNVAFALSQLPALRSLLAQLRPQLHTLNGIADIPATEDDLAKERRHYVETQSRRAMERQGLAIGSQTSDAIGKIPTAEELTALEDMVDNMDE